MWNLLGITLVVCECLSQKLCRKFQIVSPLSSYLFFPLSFSHLFTSI